jgi:hypothetical protein
MKSEGRLEQENEKVVGLDSEEKGGISSCCRLLKRASTKKHDGVADDGRRLPAASRRSLSYLRTGRQLFASP